MSNTAMDISTPAAPPSKTDRTRTAVMVLGMHRSGTSAIARFLSLLGCDLPKSLLGPGPGNQLGHWESEAIWHFNDEVLASGGSSWGDWLEFDPNWYRSAPYEGFVQRGVELLSEEFGSSSLFVLKDPRNCRLFPLWTDAFRRQHIRPVVVIALRHPDEVALSLAARDHSDIAYAQLLWLRHMLDAEFNSRGLPRVIATYDRLLDDWRSLAAQMEQAFGFFWAIDTTNAGPAIADFLNGKLRHHHLKVPDQSRPNWFNAVYHILQRWAEFGEDQNDRRQLDEIRSELNRAGPNFVSVTTSVVDKTRHIRWLEAQECAQSQEVIALSLVRDTLAQEVQTIKRREVAVELEFAQSREKAEDQIVAIKAKLEDERVAEVTAISSTRDAIARELEAVRRQEAAARLELVQMRDEAEAHFAAAAKQASLSTELIAAQSVACDQLAQQLSAVQQQYSTARQELERKETLNQSLLVIQLNQLREIEYLNTKLAEADNVMSDLINEHRQIVQTAGILDTTLMEVNARSIQLKENYNSQFENFTALSIKFENESEKNAVARNQIDWLSQVVMAISVPPNSWAALQARWYQRQTYQLLRRNKLFDAGDYLSRHVDVAEAEMDALQHYIMHGMSEGRTR